VEAGGDALSLEWPLALEALTYGSEYRHLPLGPSDPAHTLGGLAEVLDVVAYAAQLAPLYRS
jgi:hypothetical protein